MLHHLRSKMKTLTTISILLYLSSIASATICFSAEEVDAFAADSSAPAAATSAADSGSGAAGVAPTTATAAASNASSSDGVVFTAPAIVLASQSTRTAGSAGTLNGIGGGGGSPGDLESPATSDEVTAAQQNGPASDDAGAVSMPEPSTSVVWILLAACGFGFVRFRNRK